GRLLHRSDPVAPAALWRRAAGAGASHRALRGTDLRAAVVQEQPDGDRAGTASLIMRSRRPYLIRALYEWLVDSNDVPHLLVDATLPDVSVPEAFIQDGRIVLNVGPSAVQMLEMGNERFSFSARFQGTPHIVSFPPAAVIAIYGRDSGQGMMFGPEDDPDGTPASEGGESAGEETPPKRGKPSLKVIK